MSKPSKPWRVSLHIAGESLHTSHRSQRAAYEQVNTERAAIQGGTSTVTRIRVFHWEAGRWCLYDDRLEES